MLTSSGLNDNGIALNLLPFGCPPGRDARAVGRANRAMVLHAARWHGPASVRTLASLTGLGHATAFSIAEGLVADDLLSVVGLGESTGGRRPVLYGFNSDAYCAIGVDVGGMGRVRSLLVNLDGAVLGEVVTAVSASVHPQQLAQAIGGTVGELVRQGGIRRDRLKGIGVAMTGLVDFVRGVVVFDGYRVWHDIPLAHLLRSETGLPSYLINHSNAVVLGEKWCGAGRELNTFACVNVGVSVGAGLMIGGQIFPGAANMAGQLGHTIVDDAGPLCTCGKHGCLGVLAGGQAIVRNVVLAMRSGATTDIRAMVNDRDDEVTTAVVAQAAANGDSFAIQTIQEAGRYLGIAVASLVNLLNPEAVLISGDITLAGDVLLEAIRSAVSERAMSQLAASVRILATGLGLRARGVGAAIVALEREIYA